MAKRKNTAGRRSESSLVALAKSFEVLSAEVKTLRASLAAKESRLAQVHRALAAATGSVLPHATTGTGGRSAAGRGRKAKGPKVDGRAPREGTLGDYILKLMADGTERGPADVLEGVRKAGYRSDGNSKTQAVMVNQTLSRLSKAGMVRKIGRGRYHGATK